MEPLSEVRYLTIEQVIEINRTVLREIKVKKADSHRVASRRKIEAIVATMESLEGDIHEKAACLLIQLVTISKGHAFDSGNRRTAYAAAKIFLHANGEASDTKFDPKVFTGIREGFYETWEVVPWLKGDGIREFKRP